MDNLPDLSLSPMRDAITSGELPEALVLWNAYVPRFADAMQLGQVTLGQWRELGEFVAWARLAALTERAFAQDQLQSLHVTATYGDPAPPARPNLLQARL